MNVKIIKIFMTTARSCIEQLIIFTLTFIQILNLNDVSVSGRCIPGSNAINA